MKKVLSLFFVVVFTSVNSLNAYSYIEANEPPCSVKSRFAAEQMVKEYEDANYWEVYFYAYGKCMQQEFGG